MIQKRADAFGCLAIAFMGAFFLAWVLLALGSLGDLPDERKRSPLWASAAVMMTLSFGTALGVATYFTPRLYRRAVFLVGLAVAVGLYFLIGVFWWFRP